MSQGDQEALLRLFQEEAEEHLRALSKALLALDAGGAGPEAADEGLEEALRRLHSLKGAGRLAGAEQVAGIAHALETVLAEARARRLSLAAGGLDVVLGAMEAMRDCVDALPGAGPVDGAKDAVSGLFALAAGGRAQDAFDRRFPGLDPEVRGVLLEFQRSDALVALESGKRLWAASLATPPAEVRERLEAARGALQEAGELLGMAGVSSPDDGSLRFTLLVATRRSEEAMRALGAEAGLALEDPCAAPAAAAPDP
ncbi:MAG: Hpt domain-containing protein, partial [Elusimicrobia bacterium]|nr:Hpt domain-containing protein [Elusimicrobiota bacterium]